MDISLFDPAALSSFFFFGWSLKRAFKSLGKHTWRSHSFRRVAAVAGVAVGAWAFMPAGFASGIGGKIATGAKALLGSKAVGGAAASLLASRFGGGTPAQDTMYSAPYEGAGLTGFGPDAFYGGGFGGTGGGADLGIPGEDFQPAMNPFLKMGLWLIGGIAALFLIFAVVRRF